MAANSELTSFVYVQWPGGRAWECMAAFNCKEAANAYADTCREARKGTGLVYKVEHAEPEEE